MAFIDRGYAIIPYQTPLEALFAPGTVFSVANEQNVQDQCMELVRVKFDYSGDPKTLCLLMAFDTLWLGFPHLRWISIDKSIGCRAEQTCNLLLAQTMSIIMM
jgi:hypothetical protein